MHGTRPLVYLYCACAPAPSARAPLRWLSVPASAWSGLGAVWARMLGAKKKALEPPGKFAPAFAFAHGDVVASELPIQQAGVGVQRLC